MNPTEDQRSSRTESVSPHRTEHDQPSRPSSNVDPEKNAVPDQSTEDDSHPQLYNFWAPELAQERKTYLAAIAKLTFLIILLIWGIMAVYWGSLWKANTKTGELEAWIINRDSAGGTIGNTTISALLESKLNNEFKHLNWQVIDPAQYPTAADVQHAVAVDEKAWMAVEITQDVTARLFTARANGDASWSPQGQVMMYYSEARSNTAVPGYVLSPTQQLLTMTFSRLASQLAADYLTQIAGNATAVSALARAPQTIANPIVATPENLRPFNQPVATAPTFVGLIYIVILALNVTLGNFGMRQAIQSKLKISSLIAMRFLIPITMYLVLSFNYSMLNLPFQLDFNGWKLGYGAGFMTFAAATWCGMVVLGLIIECALCLVGQQFIGFFLIVLIIANVSTVVLPTALQPHFYRYGYALPFFHLKSIYTCIIFNTGKHVLILYHFGILWVWFLILGLTFPIWIILERKRLTPAAKVAAKK